MKLEPTNFGGVFTGVSAGVSPGAEHPAIDTVSAAIINAAISLIFFMMLLLITKYTAILFGSKFGKKNAANFGLLV
jgi:ABC-type methionine transport system permease subunit